MPNKSELSDDRSPTSPDYERLVSFLIMPFLDDPQSLCVNSEINPNKRKIWLRVAFDKSDRGKVFGRGGRNIQAIRIAIQTAATAHNESVYLDVYSDEPEKSEDFGRQRRSEGNNRRRKSAPKPPPKIARK